MLDDADDFFGVAEMPIEARPLGLVVPARARLILSPKGEPLFDELAEDEREFRKAGRRRITFLKIDDETGQEGPDLPDGSRASSLFREAG